MTTGCDPTTKMGIQEFGDALIRTKDLDPLYVGLVGANLPRDQLARYLLAYLCFYHAGSAAWISEHRGGDYWHFMGIAAKNETGPASYNLPSERWPRAAERRHFRGQKCVRAVEWLSKRAPEWWWVSLTDLKTGHEVMTYVQSWPMFGPWVAFKAADMMERVWGLPVAFDHELGLMYEEPRAALDLLVGGRDQTLIGVSQEHNNPRWWYDNLLTYFSARRAPPRLDRACGPQEVETVLCKWKSYVGGHYWVGKDVHEQRAALAGWGETARRILRAYPSEVPAQEPA